MDIDQFIVSNEWTKQVEEAQNWTEPCVWTERMLTTLYAGTVKGGKWHSLIDKIYQMENLRAAFKRVKANNGSPGVDHVNTEHFEKRLEKNLAKLQEQLKNGSYRPQAVKRLLIPKTPGGKRERPLGVPTVRERVVQMALKQVIEPIFEQDFSVHSYGFRPKRGCHQALKEVEEHLKDGYLYVVDADIEGFFDAISHKLVMENYRERIADNRVLNLIEQFLKQTVRYDGIEWSPICGVPQGSVIGPLTANLYLDAIDHQLANHNCRFTRYADDQVLLCRTREEAEEMLEILSKLLRAKGLNLSSKKTKIVDMHQQEASFEFLGYEFHHNKRNQINKRIRKKSVKKIKSRLRELTPRNSGRSLEATIQRCNKVIRAWYNYFRYSKPTFLQSVEGWLRGRLRAILNKRIGKSYRTPSGYSNRRWPNSFFAEHGLFSMTQAHAKFCQSASR